MDADKADAGNAGHRSCSKLIFNMALQESRLKREGGFVLREYEKATGRDLLGSWPIEMELPWDRLAVYNKAGMVKLRNRNLASSSA